MSEPHDPGRHDRPTASRRLTIVIGADTFPPNVNGAARFAQHLASGMAARGHDVHIVAPAASRRHGTWSEEYDGQRVTAHRLLSWRWYSPSWLRFALPWRIKENSARILDEVMPDVVHFQSHIITGRGLSIEAKRRGIRVVGTNHFMPENLFDHAPIPKALRRLSIRMAWRAAARSFARADVVTSPTPTAAHFLEEATGLTGVLAVSCGIDISRYIASFEPRPVPRILFVGRVMSEKQLPVLLRAFAVLPRDLGARLDIVGDGDQLHELEGLARTLGVDGRVTFAGYLDEARLHQAYTTASVLAMPSTAELQSIVTMEAMASGLPVVAADAMALPHLVHDGENGYLFPPGDVAALAARLQDVLRAPAAKMRAMQEASLRIVAAHDMERTLDTFERLYRGLAAEPAGQGTDGEVAARHDTASIGIVGDGVPGGESTE
ncbi:MAG TPA: glycosyltransferase [Microbacteriaceae bacterium]|nr:glycosyltransferase [Microbacteriaceae bacterium]